MSISSSYFYTIALNNTILLIYLKTYIITTLLSKLILDITNIFILINILSRLYILSEDSISIDATIRPIRN